MEQRHEDFFLPRSRANQAEKFDLDKAINSFKQAAEEYYARRPGFFTPYRSASDFGLTLAEPITATFGFALLTAISAVIAALAVAVCLASLIVAGGAAIFRNREVSDTALAVAAISSIVAGIAILLTPIFAAFTIMNPITSIATIIARSGASAVDAIGNCCQAKDDDDDVKVDDSIFAQTI